MQQQLDSDFVEVIDELWGSILDDLEANMSKETIVTLRKFGPLFGLYMEIRDVLKSKPILPGTFVEKLK